MTLLKSAEDFYAANTALVDGIVSDLEARGAGDGMLDELIHEAAENGRFSSDDASNVNNQGLTLQVASLIEGNGLEQAKALIQEELVETGQVPTR